VGMDLHGRFIPACLSVPVPVFRPFGKPGECNKAGRVYEGSFRNGGLESTPRGQKEARRLEWGLGLAG